ncbi:serine threonine kinase protein [Rutstroemia sp. NJR-2017a WRK4]|nr:serine threonine kinase protein [Rutstroemia sp. NJR-2017a WRK4]
MTNLDPGKRAEMADIMMDPYWDGVGSRGIFDTEECFTNEAKSVSYSIYNYKTTIYYPIKLII